MTGQAKIRRHVRCHPGSSAHTVAKALDMKWGTVSSFLYKEYRAGRAIRAEGEGPGGGFGYWM